MQTAFAGSHARYKAWLAATTTTHRSRVRVDVLNLEGRRLASLTPMLLDGNVSTDTSGREALQVLEISFADPRNRLAFERGRSDGASLYRDRMLRVARIDALDFLRHALVFLVLVGEALHRPVLFHLRVGLQAEAVGPAGAGRRVVRFTAHRRGAHLRGAAQHGQRVRRRHGTHGVRRRRHGIAGRQQQKRENAGRGAAKHR